MAQRRMFSKQITESDSFLDMPLSTQCLYFHLNMAADDDGFVNSTNRIVRSLGATRNDLDLLIAKKFILVFDSGVIVIKHWRINNYLRNDRYRETAYLEEKTELLLNENHSYKKIKITDHDVVGIPSGIPLVDVGKDRIGKDRIGKDRIYTPVVSYLNLKAGTSFRESSSKTKSLIDARANEGYSENDFKKVIDNKVAEWKGTDMEKYLRPETLFGTKFEAYLNQKTKSIDSNERYKAKEWDPDELR